MPLTPPPNPAAAQARSDMREYNAPLMVAPPVDEAAFIAAVFERWPDMLPYADTARIGMVYDAQRETWRRCVTVTIR